MARACKTCIHPQREAIDRALVAGMPRKEISQQFGVSEDSVARHYGKGHKPGHVAAELVQAKKAATIASADSLLDFLEELRTSALAILREAEAGFDKVLGFTQRDGVVVREHVRDHALALEAIDRLTKLVELLAKVQGQLPTGPTINIWTSVEWVALRSTILQALAPYPEARIAVASALAGQAQPALPAPQLLSIPLSQPAKGANAEHEISVLTGDSGGYGDRTAPAEAQ